MAMRNFNQNSPRPRAQSYSGQQNVNPSAAYPGESPNYLNNPRFQPAGQTGDQDVSVVRQTRTQVIETEPENQAQGQTQGQFRGQPQTQPGQGQFQARGQPQMQGQTQGQFRGQPQTQQGHGQFQGQSQGQPAQFQQQEDQQTRAARLRNMFQRKWQALQQRMNPPPVSGDGGAAGPLYTQGEIQNWVNRIDPMEQQLDPWTGEPFRGRSNSAPVQQPFNTQQIPVPTQNYNAIPSGFTPPPSYTSQPESYGSSSNGSSQYNAPPGYEAGNYQQSLGFPLSLQPPFPPRPSNSPPPRTGYPGSSGQHQTLGMPVPPRTSNSPPPRPGYRGSSGQHQTLGMPVPPRPSNSPPPRHGYPSSQQHQGGPMAIPVPPRQANPLPQRRFSPPPSYQMVVQQNPLPGATAGQMSGIPESSESQYQRSYLTPADSRFPDGVYRLNF